MKFYVILFVILIIVNSYMAMLMEDVVEDKGYPKDGGYLNVWRLCFFLGIFAYLYVIALPNRVLKKQNEEIIKLLKDKECNREE